MGKIKKLSLALAALALVACGEKKNTQSEEVAVVRLDVVRSEGAESRLQYPGRIVAASEAKVSFKVAGTLQRVLVNEGDIVKAGQLIAELDDKDYRVQLSATQAEHAQIKADAERVIALYKDGGTTASNYDKARYGLEQIEAKLQHHTNQLAYTKIYAPFGGRVQTRYYQPGETVGAGMPVLALQGNGALEVEINLPATAYVGREHFSGYSCTLDVLPGEPQELQFVSLQPQANANQLYTMHLRMKEPNAKIAPGMSAWVTISTTAEGNGEMRIPSTALVEQQGNARVYIYNEKTQTVQSAEVSVERLHTDGTAVVRGQLQEGQQVVSSGAHHVKDGQRVRPLAPVSKTNVGGML